MNKDRLTIEEINAFNPSPENPLEVECDDGWFTGLFRKIRIISTYNHDNDKIKVTDLAGDSTYLYTAKISISHYPSIKDRLGFQVGDEVEAFGCNGTVRYIESDPTQCRPVLVCMDAEVAGWSRFTMDGKSEKWHKTPSLKLIKRPKKKVKKSFWLWTGESGGLIDVLMDESGVTPSNKKHFSNTWNITKIPGTEVVLDVEVK
jgi:hypothetical protein